ncbi:MAG: mechanosensitive ion channel [Flammeovirgaceae bacterium]|nr:mechanosensitive ion channel [Flammeovirgaceae bacterium]
MGISDILNYSFTIGEKVITMDKVLAIVLIILFTYFILFIIRKTLKRYFRRRGVDRGRQHALNTLIKYFVWTITAVIILEYIGYEITFLVAGSAALLVGLGFGLQQIFQDLVSGIFILIEGVVRIGDVIEYDGQVGRILEINLRTSQVLSRDGIVIIVPNHKFITDSITNWSQGSDATRFKVNVGVAYGSDVGKVKEILMDVALSHSDIISDDKTKYPLVRFTDFGNSSLDFELFFWSTNIFQIENTKSDLRFIIDRKFREDNVVIPFPQRDLHIKSGKL